MYIPRAVPYLLLPLVFAFGAKGARSQAPATEPDKDKHDDTLRNIYHEALLDINELEKQVNELNQALALEESNARGLQEQLERVQDQLNDARDLAYANIPIV